ncbi:MAG: hypothetical protein JKY61_04820 [Planctomycetes bacterium]|nr:hypothetical protein [Planctomycetota bacterium]
MHYASGEELRSGDKILEAGSPGSILFVLGKAGCEAGHEEMKAWLESEQECGFMLECQSMGLVLQSEPDEDLEFLGRG